MLLGSWRVKRSGGSLEPKSDSREADGATPAPLVVVERRSQENVSIDIITDRDLVVEAWPGTCLPMRSPWAL